MTEIATGNREQGELGGGLIGNTLLMSIFAFSGYRSKGIYCSYRNLIKSKVCRLQQNTTFRNVVLRSTKVDWCYLRLRVVRSRAEGGQSACSRHAVSMAFLPCIPSDVESLKLAASGGAHSSKQFLIIRVSMRTVRVVQNTTWN